MDTTWSETGDRYMLKLFRDFLFHSVTDDGRPWIDQAHIVSCLNKLDSGVNEKVNQHKLQLFNPTSALYILEFHNNNSITIN